MAVILTQKNLDEAMASRPKKGDNEVAVGTGAAPAAPAAPPASKQPDDAFTRTLKLIPGEATLAYTTALALGGQFAGSGGVRFLPIAAFVLCAALVPLVIRRDARRNDPPVKPMPLQYAIQLAAFAAWAFSISNPLAAFGLELPPWVPALATIFVPVFGAQLLGDPPPAPAGATT